MRLSREQLRSFLIDGYVVVPDLLSAEQVAVLKQETAPLHEALAARVPPDVRVSWELTPPGEPRRIQQVLNAERVSPTLNAALRSEPVLDIVEELIGPDLGLFESKLLLKSARLGGEIPWHQDFAYWWQLTDAPDQVSCLVAIDDADEENGCLQVVPGSHRRGLLPHLVNARTFSRTLPEGAFDRSTAVSLPARGGTGVIFAPFLVHGSGANRSARERRSLTMVFTVTGLGVPQRETLRQRTARAPAAFAPPAALPRFVGIGPHGGQCQANYRRRELWKLAASRVRDPARAWVEVAPGAADSLEWFAAHKPAATPLARFERVGRSTSNRDDVRVVAGPVGDALEEPATAALLGETLGLLHVDGEVYGDLREPLRALAPRIGDGTVVIVDDALDAEGRPAAALDALHEAAAHAGFTLLWLARADRQVAAIAARGAVAPAPPKPWVPTVQNIELTSVPPPSAPAPAAGGLASRVQGLVIKRLWPRVASPGLERWVPIDEIPAVHGPGGRQVHCTTHERRRELWRAAIALVSDPALTWCEFGVGEGESLDWFALHKPRAATLLGFDWFEGIPEPWNTHPAGQWRSPEYAPNRPDVRIVRGLFEKTLADPAVIAPLGRQIGFLHVDCDLYSSTKTILTGLRSVIGPGTVIVFDELYGYPGWHQHEARALREHVERERWAIEYIGRADYQVALRVTSIGSGPACTVRPPPLTPHPVGVSFHAEDVERLQPQTLRTRVSKRLKRWLGIKA